MDPDPVIRGMDLRIRIHTKMSLIRNMDPPPIHTGLWTEQLRNQHRHIKNIIHASGSMVPT
jgi:hypothetical protein